MPQAQASLYQNTREFLLAHPGQYFRSEAVVEGLNLKDAKKRVRVANTLASLAQTKVNRIERRQNAQGRYEYAFLGEHQAESISSSPESPPELTESRQRAAIPTQQKARTSSIKKLANFLRAYMELSPDEQREAYEWLKEQSE